MFIVLDGLRSDKFYGSNKTSKTPNIDSLIQKGVYFDQTICHGSCTVPSVASIMTSLHPFEALIQDDNVFTINPKNRNNIQNFIDNGYTTYALHQEVLNFLGLNKIFENIETYHDSSKLWNGLGKKIIHFLKSDTMKQPWLYYVHLYDLHLLSYSKKIRLEEGPPQIHNSTFGNNHHDRLVSAMDDWIGKIIENVDLKKTLIVITSDHGSEAGIYTKEMDEFNDQNILLREYTPGNSYKLSHKIALSLPSFFMPIRKKLSRTYSKRAFDIVNKKIEPELERVEKLDLRPFEKRIMKRSVKGTSTVYDERYKVPLLFLGAGIPSNKIINQQVRSIDIFPTIIDLINLPNTKTGKRGISLLPLVNDESMKELPAFLDGSPNAPKFITENIVGVRTSHYKYFRNKNLKENIHLYDLKNDPLEEYNIVEKNPDIAHDMELLLMELQSNNGFNFEKTNELFDAEEEKKIEEKLRKLGYI